MRKIRSYLNSPDAPKLWEWFILGLLLLIPFVCFYYGDTDSIVRYEVNFSGAIAEGGGWRSFYDYSKIKAEQGGPNGYGNYATYDFPMYIVLGIWGIPLWIFLGSRGLDVNEYFLARLYGKSILLIALAICVYLVYSICKDLRVPEKNARWGAFLFASSMLVFTAVTINGQTDILGIPFILLGVRAFIRKQRGRFILFFMIALPFKQYALFVFVPLLLLAEKRIWKIALSCIEVLILKVGSNLIFDQASPGMIEKQNFETSVLGRLFANRVPVVNGSVPVIAVLLLAVCVFCYLKKEITNEEEYRKYAIFIPLLSMVCVFISFESSSYWYVHMAPYLAIMLVYNTDNQRKNFLFETVSLICLMLGLYGSRAWAFEIYGCSKMALEKLFGNYNNVQTPYMLENLVQKLPLTKYAGALYAVFVVLLLVFVWMNRPSKIGRKEDEPVRGFTLARLGLNVCICYVPLILFVYNLLFLSV